MMSLSYPQPSPSAPPSDILPSLHQTLLSLHQHPYPEVPTPPRCKRRASVAMIVRLRPSYADSLAHPPPFPATPASTATSGSSPCSPDQSLPSRLSTLFAHPSATHATPEVLFIKRAARPGDRFTSHVAFPGGKRDPSDESDLATAVRETREEIGLDLSAAHVLFAGGLPQRVITAEWGRTPLMVLAPFVFVLGDWRAGGVGDLRLQPAEVASCHWVPLQGLMVENRNCYERAEVSDRLTVARRNPVVRALLRAALGQMMFAATKLVPSETVVSTEAVGFWPDEGPRGTSARLSDFLGGVFGPGDHGGSANLARPLKLWGLTYGIVADFLDLLPCHDLRKSWVWPTISLWDTRFMIWLFTFRLRRERMYGARRYKITPPIIVDEGLGTVNRWGEETDEEKLKMESEMRMARSSAIGDLLEGYYERFRAAIATTLVLRGVVGVSLGVFLTKKYLRGGSA